MKFVADSHQKEKLARNSIARGPFDAPEAVAQLLDRTLALTGVVPVPNTGWLNAFRSSAWSVNFNRSVMAAVLVRLMSL